jgi:hypothetical protein
MSVSDFLLPYIDYAMPLPHHLENCPNGGMNSACHCNSFRKGCIKLIVSMEFVPWYIVYDPFGKTGLLHWWIFSKVRHFHVHVHVCFHASVRVPFCVLIPVHVRVLFFPVSLSISYGTMNIRSGMTITLFCQLPRPILGEHGNLKGLSHEIEWVK